MNIKKIQQTAQNLAKRYKNRQEYDDLVSTGILAGLEAKEAGKDAGLIVGDMRRAMHDYYNISLKPVSIPKSGEARAAVAKVSSGDIPEDSVGTERLLIMALVGETDMVEPNTLRTQDSSTEAHYLQEDLIEYIKHVIDTYLTEEEGKIIKGFYLEEKTISVLAEELKLSDQTIQRRKALGIDKIKRTLKERGK